MKSLMAFAVLALAAVGSADDARSEAIWTAAHNRYVTQMDRWFEDGDFPRCIQLLSLMHQIDPADYETTTDLGWMYGNIERKDLELEVYQDYRKAFPDDPEAPYPEAEFYYFKKEYEKVPPLIEPTIAKKPHPNSYRILAHSYEKTGKLKDSLRIWDAYIARFPDDQTALNNRKRVAGKLK